MTNAKNSQTRFVSLRWRLILPTFVIVLVLAMGSSYLVARSLPSGAEMSRVNVLLNTGRSISGRATMLFDLQQSLVQQLSQMPEVLTAMRDRNTDDLHILLENFARRADLDSVLLTDADGQDIVGTLRDRSGTYAPVTVQTASGQVLFAQTPVYLNGAQIGTAMVGTRYTRWLEDIRGSAAAEVALYQETRLLATTANSLPASIPAQYVQTTTDKPFQALDVGGTPYLGAYFPLDTSPAVVAVFVPDNAPFAAEAGQQLIALTLATVAAGVVITMFVMTNVFLERVNRVREVVDALASGGSEVRTNMMPTDEISALGYALDKYTDKVQEHADGLRVQLRRTRREADHLQRVIEALPDGVIIEDTEGNVSFINEHAKKLIGEKYNFFKRSDENEITAAVTDTLGPAYAPGLYSLGTAQRMELDGKMLRVQSFAVMSMADQRVGTVIVVRDVTADSKRERASAVLLEKMAASVPKSLPAEVALSTKQLKRNIGALQKMIVEMRELISNSDAQLIQQVSRPLTLDTLIWAVCNEWKQVAQAANVTLNVNIERPGLQIMGDERRLRWALGNIVDNAIKYTTPGGRATLEIKGVEDGFARLRVRDTGVGIPSDELTKVFVRFFRGTPTNLSGRALNVPGTGQGLTIARQIIEAHGGRIHLRSAPGIGTAVYFTLPLVESSKRDYVDEPEEETVPMTGV